MNSAKLIAINFAIPLIVAFLFIIFNIYQTNIPSYLLSIAPFLFYLLSIIVLAISWHFNRLKFIFALLPLVILYASFSFISKENSTIVYQLFSIIYPLHLLVFLLFKERGLFTIWGYFKILL